VVWCLASRGAFSNWAEFLGVSKYRRDYSKTFDLPKAELTRAPACASKGCCKPHKAEDADAHTHTHKETCTDTAQDHEQADGVRAPKATDSEVV
jgi:hypothetical protein